jgi:hypothetical protein
VEFETLYGCGDLLASYENIGSYSECCALCSGNDECLSWSWLTEEVVRSDNTDANGTCHLNKSFQPCPQYELSAVSGLPNISLVINVLESEEEMVSVVFKCPDYDAGMDTLRISIDRHKSSAEVCPLGTIEDRFCKTEFGHAHIGSTGHFDVSIVVDGSLIEVFVAGVVFTTRAYPDSQTKRISAWHATEVQIDRFDAWRITLCPHGDFSLCTSSCTTLSLSEMDQCLEECAMFCNAEIRSSNDSNTVIIASIVGVVGSLALIAVLFALYRRQKKSSSEKQEPLLGVETNTHA